MSLTFPVQFEVFGRAVPAHAVFELLGYVGGFQLYLRIRRREITSGASAETHVWIVAGAVLGALVGAKVLASVESFSEYWPARANPLVWLGGKTIVGGLLGGWIGVEIVKRLRGVRGRTGDAFVFPLILGIAVGRIGCFLTGLPDHTHGVHSSLPWAVDFGDGPRHPTQLYEVAFLLMLGMILALRSRRPYGEGELFRIFMLGYLGFRLAVEFVKPVERHAGLSAIQWACLLGIVACVRGLWRVWIQDGAMPIAEVTP